jgi:hypothetical protein
MTQFTPGSKNLRRIIFRYVFPSLGALAATTTIIVNYPRILVLWDQMHHCQSIQQIGQCLTEEKVGESNLDFRSR